MVDAYASEAHYADHLRPVVAATGGRFLEDPSEPSEGPILVASFRDYRRTKDDHRVIVTEHGIGQSYSDDTSGYPGGKGYDDAFAFLTPNEHAAARWRAVYPDIPVEVVGSPRVDGLPRDVPAGPFTVAITFHWECFVAPETRSALGHYRSVLPYVSKVYNVIGHGHPRGRWDRVWSKAGIEYVRSFSDVLRRAHVLVADNTSALYEFASLGRPVVVLNAPWYRRDADHGLRFWDAASVGWNVNEPRFLAAGIDEARRDAIPQAREDALDIVYAHRGRALTTTVNALRGLGC